MNHSSFFIKLLFNRKQLYTVFCTQTHFTKLVDFQPSRETFYPIITANTHEDSFFNSAAYIELI